ncbi:hypothetical protein K227x_54320 [Rubripirellula lacrimiformis]|uniref:Uncharacterized protein n=1 Tax=Rubripirellula lacrimiformis TaxID=1930273 RepID=A0A517NIU6_9BACT|nr:hypothetical protein K227x_54320 [Rubripirellula lacrimiformis]
MRVARWPNAVLGGVVNAVAQLAKSFGLIGGDPRRVRVAGGGFGGSECRSATRQEFRSEWGRSAACARGRFWVEWPKVLATCATGYLAGQSGNSNFLTVLAVCSS